MIDLSVFSKRGHLTFNAFLAFNVFFIKLPEIKVCPLIIINKKIVENRRKKQCICWFSDCNVVL